MACGTGFAFTNSSLGHSFFTTVCGGKVLLTPPPPAPAMAQEDTRSFWPVPCVLGHPAVARPSCLPKPAENSAPGMDCGVSEGALGLVRSSLLLDRPLSYTASAPPHPLPASVPGPGLSLPWRLSQLS